METIICEVCSQPFKVKRYRKDKARFCSSACYGVHQSVERLGYGRKRVIVQCNTCGQDIEKRPSDINNHNFCNRQCWAKWRSSGEWSGENNSSWLGGHSQYRGANWKQQSNAALERDNYTCQDCGISGVILHVHHKKPYHLFEHYKEANAFDNLISLCPTCHMAAENLFWEQNPDLVNHRRIPNCTSVRICHRCKNEFHPRSPATRFCDSCCTFTCANCHNTFYSRKTSDRVPKYCNRACRNEHIKRHKMPRRKSSVTT